MKLFAGSILLAGLAVAGTALAQNASDPVAKVGDKLITRQQLLDEAARDLTKIRQDEYNVLKNHLDEMIDDMLIKASAEKLGKSDQDLLKERIDSKVTEPTDQEVQALYDQYKARLNGQTLEQVKPRLVEMQKQQQKSKLYGDLVAQLRKETGAVSLLEPPRAQVSVDDDPAQGPADAPITMIAFSDYQCPYCKRVEPTIAEVLKKYDGKIRYVFRDYPLSFHPFAQKAAEAAGCAEEQGKFWEMHQKLFDNNTALTVDNLKQYAADLKLDPAQFTQCLDSGKRAQEVAADETAGSAVGVTGTPAFFINGRIIPGAAPIDSFTEIIDDELARADAKKTASASTSANSKKGKTK